MNGKGLFYNIQIMVDIEKIKPEIIESLKSLDPEKIILFGSYANGSPNDDSDIDLMLLKGNLSAEKARTYRVDARLNLRKLIKKYEIGFDILSDDPVKILNRKDYFYKIDILQNGKILYERNSG